MSHDLTPTLVSFQAATEGFRAGTDSPRDFLERAIDKLEAAEPTLKAFAALAIPRARIVADGASLRWKEGRPVSRIDGMPIGIKDIIETFDMPMGLGSPTASGFQPVRDAAVVHALRDSGAAIVGKTKTTEFAGSYATDTRNPHDPTRTSGGSSAGSASAVVAGILPVALGTQVIGSTLRPASFCGAFGFKPTLGAINRGGSHDFQSHSCIGVIGASLADIWFTKHEMVQRAGGDPGAMGLIGKAELAAPVKPGKLILLQTPAWDDATASAREQLLATVSTMSAAGVQILSRDNHEGVAKFETALLEVMDLALDIVGYESRWPLKSVAYRDRDGLSPSVLTRIKLSDELGLDGYRALLTRRAAMREAFETLAREADAFITLGATGAAPKGIQWTGNPMFNVPASVLGAPALSLPVYEDEGMPLGLQLMGAQHTDEKLFAIANYVMAR